MKHKKTIELSAKKIKALMQKEGIETTTLARMWGKTRQTTARYVHGEVDIPLTFLMALCKEAEAIVVIDSYGMRIK